LIVDIYYDLVADSGTTYRVSIAVSNSGGEPYTIFPSARAVSGAIGSGIAPGIALHAVWDAGAERGNLYTDRMRVKVTADLE
jgi:hypothetical protein